MNKTLLVISSSLVIMIGSLFTVQSSAALTVDNTCSDIETVFARGSGQALSAGESKRFQGQLALRIPSTNIAAAIMNLAPKLTAAISIRLLM